MRKFSHLVKQTNWVYGKFGTQEYAAGLRLWMGGLDWTEPNQYYRVEKKKWL